MAEIVHESMVSKDVHASDSADLLLTQKRLRLTERCSTPDEMVQFDRSTGDGTGEKTGLPDRRLDVYELHDNEDTSPNQPSGPLVGQKLRSAPDEPAPSGPLAGQKLRSAPDKPTPRFATRLRYEDEAPKPLLECLIATAKNPWTDDTCEAVIVFDHHRKCSVISKELVRELKLPCFATPTQDSSTFTGYNAEVDLLYGRGLKLSLNHLATGPLPDLVRTVFTDEKVLAALRRNQKPLDVIYAQPHLLIGADEMTRIQYRHGQCLRDHLFSVHTCLGVALGGSLEADAEPYPKDSPHFWSSSSSDAAPISAAAKSSSPTSAPLEPLNLEPSPSRLHLWLQDLSPDSPKPCGSQADSVTDGPKCFSTDLVGGTAVCVINKFLEPSSSTSSTSGHLLQSRVPGVLPQSPQMQLPSKPLDTLPLPLLTTSATNVEVEEVLATDLVAGSPRPIQSLFRPTESCRSSPPPSQGNQIRAPLYEAGSTDQRKTRLRYRLPAFARQILGIYTAPEPVSTVTLLLRMDSSVHLFLRAEQDQQLVLMPPSPSPIRLPLSIVQCNLVLQCFAVLSPASCAAILDAFLNLMRRLPAPIQWTPTLKASGPDAKPVATSYGHHWAQGRTPAVLPASKRTTPPTSSRQLETHTQAQTLPSAQAAASSPSRSP